MSTTPNIVWDEPAHNVQWDEAPAAPPAPQGSWWDRLKSSVRETMGRLGEGQELEAQGNQQVAQEYVNKGPKEIVAGAKEIAGQAPGQTQSMVAHGFNRMVSGAGVTSIPLAASTLPIAAISSPFATGGAIAGGMAAQAVTEKGLNAAGVNPDTSKAMGNIAGLAGGYGGEKLGAKVDHIPDLVGAALDKVTPDWMRSSARETVQKLTGTTPERIAELAQVENKVADAHAIAVQAEATAKKAAQAAYPEINVPVKIGAPVPESQPFDPTATIGAKQAEIPFREAQEQYSQLGIDARAAHIARMQGRITGFDEAEILAKKNALGAAMKQAAEADGKLDQFNAANKQFAQYMNDFHNKGSAVEPLLEMKPDETNKIVSHFLNPDKGARSIETIQKYGGDAGPIQDLLSRGATPLKIDVNEAAKLRKVGTEGYGPLRLQESIDQATYNRLPSSAQARLPAASMKQYTKIPYLPEAISPSIPTRYLTKRLLSSDIAKEAVQTGSVPLKTLAGK